jgi:WXG100 family type VII secretion target
VSETQAHAVVMERTAAKFDEVNRGLEAMLKSLLSELEVLQTAWQGAAGRSFQEVKAAWAADQTAIHRNLSETAEAIRTSGQAYDATDNAASSRIAATNRGLTLPL